MKKDNSGWHIPVRSGKLLRRAAWIAALSLSVFVCGCSGSRSIEVTKIEDLKIPETDTGALYPDGKISGESSAPLSAGSPSQSGQAKAEEDRIAVYVRGAVKDPGVYYLPAGARVYQAIEAAGGFSGEADREWLNQAQALSDGEMLTVCTIEETSEMEKAGEASAAAGASGESLSSSSGPGAGEGTGLTDSASGGGRVNLNTAGKDELMTLPGIGESKAESIIRYREENGAFASPEDVMNISGIKEAVFSKIKDRICV